MPGEACPKTTYARPVPEAPIRRSPRPSPFTSPAGATALPARSPGAPSIAEALAGQRPDVHRDRVRLAVDDEHRSVRAGERRTQHDVGTAVPVDVTRSRDRKLRAEVRAVDQETVRREIVKRDKLECVTEDDSRLVRHDVGALEHRAAVADQDVGLSVAVHVAGRGSDRAEVGRVRLGLDLEADGGPKDGAEIDVAGIGAARRRRTRSRSSSPTAMSGSPSPLTSPGPATDQPASCVPVPAILNPAAPPSET